VSDPTAIGALLVALAGPYGTRDDAVASLPTGNYAAYHASVERTSARAAVVTLTNGGRKSSFPAVHGAHGWLIDTTLGDTLHDNLRSTYTVTGLQEDGPWIVLTAVDRAFGRDASGHETYYCIGTEVACWVNGDDAVCSRPLRTSGGSCDARSFRPARAWTQALSFRKPGEIVLGARPSPKLPPEHASLTDELLPAGVYPLVRDYE
jgi:hypothetical protein